VQAARQRIAKKARAARSHTPQRVTPRRSAGGERSDGVSVKVSRRASLLARSIDRSESMQALAGASEQGGSLSVLRSYGPALTHMGVVASSSHARARFR
jgi:hypothetical protein